VATVAAVLAATLAKETGITIAVVCAAPDVCRALAAAWGAAPRQSGRGPLIRVAMLAVLPPVYIAMRRGLIGRDTPRGRFEDNPLRFIQPEQRVLSALYLATENARLLVWPWVLSCDYSFNAIPFVKTHTDPRLYTRVLPLFGSLVTASAYALWLAAARRDPRLVVALSWVVFPLLPSSHIVDLGLVLAERTLFLPSVGIALLLKFFVDHVVAATEPTPAHPDDRSRRRGPLAGLSTAAIATLVACGILCGGFGVRTVVRNRDWANNTALFKAGHEAYPDSVKMLYMRGNSETNGVRAQAFYKRAIEIYPFHCYCLSSMAAYMAHPYYRDVDAAVDYATRAGQQSACYFRRGKTYFNEVMNQELAALVQTEATASTSSKSLRCKRLRQLEAFHGLPHWDKASAAAATRLKQQQRTLGCK